MRAISGSEIKKSLLASLWFIFLTFPILVMRINALEKVIEWRWRNMLYVGAGTFLLSFAWRAFLDRQSTQSKKSTPGPQAVLAGKIAGAPRARVAALVAAGALALAFPWIFSMYQTNIMTTTLIYVMLGLGLNIVVGLAGLLDLGYVAFYAVGAYLYALGHYHFGIGFWTALPLGALLAAVFGILLGFPVLRLRGDYLAIVTLGFGEIIRLILENWNSFSFGPSGIADIPRPSLFGMDLSLRQAAGYIYYVALLLTIITIAAVTRLRDSRIGRAWVALREDETACEAMGIDKTRTKLAAFALGATWAGMAGVLFAAKSTFISPACFKFMESATILCIVVLGGMGSITGVILGAFVLILLPEYLRAFSEYRMLLFGAALVAVMVFRPQGMITARRHKYKHHS